MTTFLGLAKVLEGRKCAGGGGAVRCHRMHHRQTTSLWWRLRGGGSIRYFTVERPFAHQVQPGRPGGAHGQFVAGGRSEQLPHGRQVTRQEVRGDERLDRARETPAVHAASSPAAEEVPAYGQCQRDALLL